MVRCRSKVRVRVKIIGVRFGSFLVRFVLSLGVMLIV